MEFGTRLRELREKAGLTQSDLAEGIAASSYISLLEAGKRSPKPELVGRLADRLSVPLEELILDQSSQERSWSLNVAQVALSSGDLDIAEDYANQVLEHRGVPDSSSLAASVVLIQIRVRRGAFEGVVDELEQLFKNNPLAAPDIRARIGNEIVRVCFRSGNLALGAQRGEEIVRDFAKVWPETEVVELLCLLGSCHFHRGDTQRASEIVSRALKLAEKCKSPKAIAQSQWQSSMLAGRRGDLTLALSHIREAMHWSKVAELKEVMPLLNDNAAKIMLDMNNPDLAQIHNLAEAAYLDLSAQNNPGHAAYMCITLSEVELRKGKFDDALEYINKALRELPTEMPGPKASLYSQEAKVLFRMGKVEESKVQLERAMLHMIDIQPSKELAIHWSEVARVLVEVGLKDRAIYAYEQAIAVGAASQAEQKVLTEANL